jgi:uncharacterized protein
MKQLAFSLAQARRMAVHAQLLDGAAHRTGKEGTAQAIEHLGYVQIDTIAVVERAHHHILWSRCADYSPSFLHDLVAVDRRVFEYWAHAMALLPMSDYRFYIPRMHRHRSSNRAWLSEWKKEHGHILDHVLRRIRNEGPLTSKDFQVPLDAKRGTWWDWKPAKSALEILFWQGDLMISERDGFQKVYDLTERVLPPDTDTRLPTRDELGRFHVRRALAGLGVAQAREIRDAFHVADRDLIAETLQTLEQEGVVVALTVEGQNSVYYALRDTLESVPSAVSRTVHILSPFDNLTIQRDRLSRLFQFEYTIECYVPETKRKFGYFVLPILWQDRLIGRLDAKADRRAETLSIKKLMFETGFQAFEDALPALSDTLARFAQFNGCDTIESDVIVPSGHKRALKNLLKKALDSSP